jgi:N-acetylneuraminic acid mutarotase
MTGQPMPSERSEVAVAAVEGQIYVVGGFDGQTELEVFDPTADRWTRGAPFPHTLHHAAAVGLNGKLLVIGGYSDGWTASDAVYE